MLYLSQKLNYEIQMKVTPAFKQVNFAKMIMKYLTSADMTKWGAIALLYSIKYKIKTVTHTKYMKAESGISNLDQHIAHYLVSTTHQLEDNTE